MKKIMKIMTAAALLCTVLFASCAVAEAVKESVNDSYKQWYKYKNGDKKIDIPVLDSTTADNDTTEESTTKLKNAELYFYFDPDVGLKVAIQSTTQQEVQLLKGLYTTTMDVVMGEVKDYPLSDFGKGKWAALWGSGKIEKASAPKVVTNPTECILLGAENKPKIQWKKVLANYLLNKLLED